MDYLSIANSVPMWLCVIPPISIVIIQAIIFAKKAYSSGLEIGMTKEQLNSAIRASAVSSFGPSVVILSGMLALLLLVGGPMAWMRLAYIGNVIFESLAFNFGMTASGSTPDSITPQAFTNGIWVMVLGSIGWIVCSVLFTDKMDKVQDKLSGGDPKMMSLIASGAMIGGLGSLATGYVVQFNANTSATLVGAVIMVAICAYNASRKIGWLQEWSLTIGLIGGMAAAMLLQ